MGVQAQAGRQYLLRNELGVQLADDVVCTQKLAPERRSSAGARAQNLASGSTQLPCIICGGQTAARRRSAALLRRREKNLGDLFRPFIQVTSLGPFRVLDWIAFRVAEVCIPVSLDCYELRFSSVVPTPARMDPFAVSACAACCRTALLLLLLSLFLPPARRPYLSVAVVCACVHACGGWGGGGRRRGERRRGEERRGGGGGGGGGGGRGDDREAQRERGWGAAASERVRDGAQRV